jgi:hypothetical protein
MYGMHLPYSTYQTAKLRVENSAQTTFKFSLMEQRDLKNVNNYLNTNIYSYLETSGNQSSNLYLNVVHFFNTSVN